MKDTLKVNTQGWLSTSLWTAISSLGHRKNSRMAGVYLTLQPSCPAALRIMWNGVLRPLLSPLRGKAGLGHLAMLAKVQEDSDHCLQSEERPSSVISEALLATLKEKFWCLFLCRTHTVQSLVLPGVGVGRSRGERWTSSQLV